MSSELIFIHGRAQEHKDASALKAEWISSWQEGLRKNDFNIPIAESSIRFPFYGDTLFDLVAGVPDKKVADIVVRGLPGANGGAPGEADKEVADIILHGPDSTEEKEFMYSVLNEARTRAGISDEVIAASAGIEVQEKGPLNWPWVRGIVRAIDHYLPGGSGQAIALATHDVYMYLRNPGIRDVIDTGVRKAVTPGVQTVVVSHSLGTVVAYDLLRREGEVLGWKIPLFVTLGSPLAISAIKRLLRPIIFPPCAGKWYNAMDLSDIVALNPLDVGNFDVDPTIENNTDIHNQTENHHGISGYLNDKEVARRIFDGLVTRQ
jgi:hypothetical protein